ncbi:hypothetical protein ACLOJK_027391, partial [Asimina triloba]
RPQITTRHGPPIEQGRQHPIVVDPAMAVHSAHLPSSTVAPFETHQPWPITPIQRQQLPYISSAPSSSASVPIVTSRRSTKPSNQHPISDPLSDQSVQPFKIEPCSKWASTIQMECTPHQRSHSISTTFQQATTQCPSIFIICFSTQIVQIRLPQSIKADIVRGHEKLISNRMGHKLSRAACCPWNSENPAAIPILEFRKSSINRASKQPQQGFHSSYGSNFTHEANT